MVSDFNRERELVGEYNGRQLLEMLQNADDEEARSVQIELDEHRGRLVISANFHYTLPRKPSHLLFQLRRRRLFDDFLIQDDDAIAFVNETAFDFDAPGFNGVARREMETVLVRLGAKDRIDQLSLARVAEILRSLSQHDPSGRSVQKVYRMALAHYERNAQQLPADVLLFARRGKEAGYYPQDEVYYSENNRLPRKIPDLFALLSYPRRSGGPRFLRSSA